MNKVSPQIIAKQRAVTLVFAVFFSLLIHGCSSLNLVSTDTLMEQGVALYREGKYDESILRFEEVLQREPDRYLAYLYLARSLIAEFKWDSAISNARKALELAPGNSEVIGGLAESLLGGGMAAIKGADFPRAILHLSEYLQLKPSSAEGYLGLARAYLGSRDYQQGANTLIKGLAAAEGGRAIWCGSY